MVPRNDFNFAKLNKRAMANDCVSTFQILVCIDDRGIKSLSAALVRQSPPDEFVKTNFILVESGAKMGGYLLNEASGTLGHRQTQH